MTQPCLKRVIAIAAWAWALGCAAPAWAGKAHEHGIARLDVAVEAGRVEIHLEVSLADLTGFERAPRTDAERAAVTAVLARLRGAQELFRFDGAGGCVAAATELVAPVWQIGPTPAVAAGAGGKEEHADLEARYQFRCATVPSALETELFNALPRLKRIEAQVVSAKGQMKLALRRPQARLALAR